MVPSLTSDIELQAQAARRAGQALAKLPASSRDEALEAMAVEVEAAAAQILAANQRDLQVAARMVEAGELTQAAYARLKLDPAKLAGMVAGIRQVRQLPDLVGRAQFVRELDNGLILERRTCPLGVVGVIFESRPDAVTQIAALTLKTANAVILKGGAEATHSCLALVAAIQQGWSRILPDAAIHLLTSRAETRALLDLDRYLDLLIPRGSNAFVRFVQENTRIPVLGHADGVCHLYVDGAADLDMAVRLAIDAKTQYPAACNAIETLLIDQACAPQYLPPIAAALRQHGVELRGCPRAAAIVEMIPASEADWICEYGDRILAVRVVEGLEQAMQHIQTYGSRHTEAIVTEDPVVAQAFLDGVDAAGVFHNASTRFADGYRYGFGAEVGISTQKMPPRGPVGIEGLITYKYRLRGSGQVVADYSSGARRFTHRDLS